MYQTIIPCDVGGSTVGMPVLALTSTPNKFMLYHCMGDQHSLHTFHIALFQSCFIFFCN